MGSAKIKIVPTLCPFIIHQFFYYKWTPPTLFTASVWGLNPTQCSSFNHFPCNSLLPLTPKHFFKPPLVIWTDAAAVSFSSSHNYPCPRPFAAFSTGSRSVCSKIKNLMLFTWLALFFLLGLWRWCNLHSLVWKAESSIIYWKLTFSSIFISTQPIFAISQTDRSSEFLVIILFLFQTDSWLFQFYCTYCLGTLDLILYVIVMMMLKGILILPNIFLAREK